MITLGSKRIVDIIFGRKRGSFDENNKPDDDITKPDTNTIEIEFKIQFPYTMDTQSEEFLFMPITLSLWDLGIRLSDPQLTPLMKVHWCYLLENCEVVETTNIRASHTFHIKSEDLDTKESIFVISITVIGEDKDNVITEDVPIKEPLDSYDYGLEILRVLTA